jgi:hypothetical protein
MPEIHSVGMPASNLEDVRNRQDAEEPAPKN